MTRETLVHRILFEPSEGMSMKIRFLYGNSDGCVQFLLNTGWYKWSQDHPGLKSTLIPGPKAYDLGYHRITPKHENQTLTADRCEHVGDRPCYYDGSSGGAEPILEALLAGGEKAVQRRLEEFYHQVFDNTEGTCEKRDT
jgi:hypothetical protein